MKQVAIGDVHGEDSWKLVVEQNPDADRFIFIGDYLDSFFIKPEAQLNNLKDLIEFKKQNKDRVIFLIGNHDHHYWPGVVGGSTSGYQPSMAVSYRQQFEENQELFQMAFEDEFKTLYTHAGVTKSFVNRLKEVHGDLIENTADFINSCFKADPSDFVYYWKDRTGYGRHIEQTCIWIRPEALYQDKLSSHATQVVGHTQQTGLNLFKGSRQGFYLIDTMPVGEYLICLDQEFKIGTIKQNNDGI